MFREVAEVYAELLREDWGTQRIEVVPTDAASENAELLVSGDVDAAFVTVDVAMQSADRLRAIGRIYDSVLHIVVARSASITTLPQLAGRRIAAGLPRSGTRFTLNRVLSALEIEAELVDYSQRDAVAAFRSGDVDVIASLTGTPTPAITELATGVDMSLVDEQGSLDPLLEQHPLEYFIVPITASMYPGLGSVSALAVPTVLAVRDSMPDEIAYFLTDVLFRRSGELAERRPEARHISPRMGSATTPVRLHAGSESWFTENKR